MCSSRLLLSTLVVIVLCPLVTVAWGQSRSAFLEHTHHEGEKKLHREPAILAHHHETSTTKPCKTCPGHGRCVPRVQCPAMSRGDAHHPTCHLYHGHSGVCCTTGQSHASESDTRQRTSSSVSKDDITSAHKKSRQLVAKWTQKENLIVNNENTVVSRTVPSFGHHLSTKTYDVSKANVLGRGALQNLFATQAMKERQAISDDQLRLGLTKDSDGPFCPLPPACPELTDRYRHIGGECNNPANPNWGAAHTGYERILPPNYSDGTWSPRVSNQGTPLASARAISDALLMDVDNPSARHNLMLTQFGQFLAHDLTAAVPFTFENGSAISCCTSDGSAFLPEEFQHFACNGILIESSDNFFNQFGHACMNFVRTQLAPSHDCSLGYARQMNGVTHYADLSQIYGSSEEKVADLRDPETGRLKTFTDFGRDLPPLTSKTDDCLLQQPGAACFASGDDHANQMISLVGLHTLWTREHNRLVQHLGRLNPSWLPNILFLEARRILLAEYQHIIYNEWLPLVIGSKNMEKFSLFPGPSSEYSVDYNKDVNPSLTSEFAAAAFRFGHSTIDTKITIPSHEKLYEEIAIPEVMFQPSRMRLRQFLDRMLTGLSWQPMQTVDPFISEALTRYMFHGGNPFGLDLASLNIQRGRDHGLRSYNDYMRLIGDKPFKDFAQFSNKAAQRLASVYSTTEDIDLWVGGLLELPLDDAVVGSTFSNIIADQFSRLRLGDRYFYEHGPDVNPGSFTKDQLAEIKKVTMARIICDNSDRIELFSQAPHAFLRPQVDGNDPIPCDSPHIPTMDLSKFKET